VTRQAGHDSGAAHRGTRLKALRAFSPGQSAKLHRLWLRPSGKKTSILPAPLAFPAVLGFEPAKWERSIFASLLDSSFDLDRRSFQKVRCLVSESWKVLLVVLAVIVVLYLANHPEILRNSISQSDEIGSGPSSGGESPELNASDLRGRIRAASHYALEVQSRLDAYKARFDCPEATLLDRAFLDPDGALAIHPLRKDWYSIRSELPQFLEKHRTYQDLLQRAESEIMLSQAKVKEHWTLPERADAWSRSLDDAITQRTRKLPLFTRVAHQLAAQLNAPKRRTSRP
jgi:hypothetical protein